jgi:hypothetical protein
MTDNPLPRPVRAVIAFLTAAAATFLGALGSCFAGVVYSYSGKSSTPDPAVWLWAGGIIGGLIGIAMAWRNFRSGNDRL